MSVSRKNKNKKADSVDSEMGSLEASPSVVVCCPDVLYKLVEIMVSGVTACHLRRMELQCREKQTADSVISEVKDSKLASPSDVICCCPDVLYRWWLR